MKEKRRPPDWQLPPGVNPGLWEYLQSPDLPRNYAAYLAGSPLPTVDEAFVAEYLTGPGRVLDLGCGTGRSLLPLARRGFECFGVDLSEGMLTTAADEAGRAGVSLHLLRANLVRLDGIRDGTMDYALCLFSTLGMIQGPENRLAFLRHVRRILRPGGLFLVHVHNRWWEWWNPEGRKRLLAEILGRLPAGDRILPYHQGVANLYLHLFTRRELVAGLREAGLTVVEVRPVGLTTTGRLRWPWWVPAVRAMGYLAVARAPGAGVAQGGGGRHS